MARNNSRMPPPPSAAAVAENPEIVDTPVNDLDGNPELDVASEAAPAEVRMPKALSRKKIKVTANRAGFINQERKVGGDKFEVAEHQLGSWMDCDDPVEHKKHSARMVARNKEANKRAVREHEEDIEAAE